MTGPRAAPAGMAAGGHASEGDPADHRAVPTRVPSSAGRALDLEFRSEAPGDAGSGEHGDERGQEAKWEAFFRQEWSSVVRFLLVSFGEASEPDAADAAQTAFVELFRHWDKVSSPRPWVRTVALRQMIRHRQSSTDDRLLLRLGAAAHREPWCAPPASGSLEIFDEEQAVLAILRRLPEMQRQVIALVYDGFTTRETAEMLGTTEAAVRQSLRRGRSKVRDMLYESGPAFRQVR